MKLTNRFKTLNIQLFIFDKAIQWTYNNGVILIHHMGINFSGLDIRMTHEFLDDPNINSVFQHMSCE